MVALVAGQVGTETGQESGAEQQPRHFLERLDGPADHRRSTPPVSRSRPLQTSVIMGIS
jgi:hypothetical protein